MEDFAGCCTSGKPAPDDYKPRGRHTRLGALNVYTSVPSQTNTSQEVLLLLPDGFGLANHNIILADRFAEKLGLQVVVPDYYEGDPLPVELIKYERKPGVALEDQDWPQDAKDKVRNTNLDEWLKKHPHNQVDELLQGLVASIHSFAPNAQFLGIGYCFGGKHVFRMAKESLKVAVSFHPSFVVHEDLKGVQVPTYIGLAEKDDMVPASLPLDLQTWTQGETNQTTIEIYPEVGHGFAARPETENPVIREQYERAFNSAVEFLQRAHAG